MSAQSSAREEILARIRAALPASTVDPASAHAAIAKSYNRSGERSPEQTIDLLLDRLHDYDSEILQLDHEAGLPQAIAQTLQRANEQRVLIAPEFPSAWLPGGFNFIADHALPITTLESAQAVLTTCEAAVSSTGTIIFVHKGAQGRRAITLLPDHHICLLRRNQVFETLPQAFETIAGSARLPITTISGPSATSDIEMTRIRGVHGPRRLTVILYGSL